MQSDLNVGGKNVLAVVLTEPCVKDALTHSVEEIGKAIVNGYGENNVAKDFLMEGCQTAVIKRGHSSRKRKCCVLYMSRIGPELVKEIKKGILLLQNYIYKIKHKVQNPRRVTNSCQSLVYACADMPAYNYV